MKRKKFKGLNRILSMMLVFVMGFTFICATILADDETTPDHSAATETVTLTAIESLTADTEIVAYFYQQTYTITVGIGTNGSVKYYYPSTSESSSEFEDNVAVDFGENSTVKVVATPNIGYHVSEVTIDGDPQTDVDTSNDSTYTKEITITGDTIITVTFEINTYTLTVEETGEDVSGTVTVDGSEYSGALTYGYGSNATLTITPPSGYNVSVTVNGENVTLAYDHDHSCFTYTISSISENISVLVEYSEYGTLEASDVLTCSTCSNTGTDPDGNTIYYYRSSATISVSDSYENTYKILQSDGSYETTYIVSETTDGTLTITLFDGEKWYTVDTGIIFLIDTVAPVIEITSAYDGSWTNEDVTVTGTVDDGDDGSGIASLYYTYTDEDGETVTVSVDITYDTSTSGSGRDQTTMASTTSGTFSITFEDEQNIDYTFYAEDTAGNETEITDLTVKIDTTAPEVVTFEFEGEDGEPVENTGGDYGYFFGENITVTITAEDESPSSGIDSIAYYLVDVYDGTTDTVTASVDEDGQISFTLSADFKGYIYAKAADDVGNEGEYVSPSGTVLETEDMHSDTASIVFDYDDPNSNGYYDDDVEVIVTVSDTYSGIASIEWSVTSADPSNDQSGTESGFTTVSKDENLITSMSKTITVSSNSNDIVLKVTLTDNAGNTTTKSITLDIDKTDPEISVSYSNNNAENGTYFDANRTATITITERNLDTSDVVITVTKDGSSYSVGSLKWTKKSGSGNGDGTTWTAKITYSSDGDYTFSISAKDLAGNKNGSVSYGSSVAPTSFTIDKTAPVISVSYSNNNASNGTYFNASRTATITITEHNFDPSLVEITVTASLDESTISTPAVSSWSTSGNTHTATIVYSADGDHTFDISMTDLAGNANSGVSYGSSVAYDSFTIDTTLYTDDGTGIITGVEDGAAYSGDVIPGVYFNDINYDEGSVVITLTRTRKGEIDEDVTDEFITGNYTETSSGVSAVFDVFDKTKDNDGIYTLYVSYLDLAGNFVSQSVTFTINRYGSVYVYSDDLADLISDGGAYVQSVSGLSLIITEYNPDKLVEDSLSIEITLDGKPLENVIYTVTPVINDEVETGESGWYQYEYVLSEENFTSDGVYKITISSTDETGNNSENTNEEIYDEIIFRIDTTAPEITGITGLEKSIINARTQEVTFTVYDTIGLYQIVVTVTDADGDVILTCTISGDDFNGDINNYTGTFLLTESGPAQTITIEVTDMAGNVIKTSDESFDPAYTVYTTVTLSTNFFVRWYANTFLFWFSVAAIVIIIGLIIFFILFKKRKKEDEEEAGTTAAQE